MKNKKFGLRYWLNLITLVILSLALTFLIVTVNVSYRLAQAYLHPSRSIPSAEALTENNISYQAIELTTKDGVKLSAWYTPPAKGNDAVILSAHGYSGNRAGNPYVLFASRGYGVLAWDFRAHGKSGGDISTLGYYEQLDVEAALDYALAQPDVKHIGAWGGSMGAATVILVAAKRPEIEAVVSDSAFPTLEDALKLNLPIQFMRSLSFLWEFSSGAKINQVRPVDEIAKISPRATFVIDGWEGGAVLMNSPHRLYDAANEPKQIWMEDGVPHLGMYGAYPKQYEEKVIAFFDKYLLGK